MADLTDLESAASVKVVGASSTGVESTFTKVSANQDLGTSDVVNTTGTEGSITVGTTAVEVKIGGSNLANRKSVTAFNNGTALLYWGYTSSVTTSNGTPLFKKQLASWAIGPDISIYLISGSAGQDVRVTESA